ncbi:MAG: radical SAM/Cys-rich domain protein [Kiritimatiellaeota bacterium]|nr:radical SAM/Cys-rich domain protein [Kiritimatiellota bacterium]
MNRFDLKLREWGQYPLTAVDTATVQVNLGLVCNQNCRHCHVGAGPDRPETMTWETMEAVLAGCRTLAPDRVDLTGGAPELNPYFRRLIRELRGLKHRVQVRTNLTALLGPDCDDLPDFFREHRIELVASLPCYTVENVEAQRGRGVHVRSIEALRRLNAVGYGDADSLPLDLVYNPGGPFLPPPQSALETDYRDVLRNEYGVFFSRLLTITNMPVGRFQQELDRQGGGETYRRLLEENFNADTLDGLMCRHQVNIGWDGTLFDCDFNLALGLPVQLNGPAHIARADLTKLAGRRIVTDKHCFGCTAGCGSSCGGALTKGQTSCRE